ncbi:MAG: pyridoxamine 5'-phosphate oxidase family protein [Anaerolineaceae bacterium]
MNWKYSEFIKEDIETFYAPMKIGLLATINADGEPHITLLSSLMASNPKQVIWGQFTEGLSKVNVLQNPKTGFMIMSLDKNIWMGQATWTHTQKNGVDYDRYNNQPMFRYNAYFGVHTVHYMDLVGQSGKIALPMNSVIFSALKTTFAKPFQSKNISETVMNPWTQKFLGKLDGLKFISFIDANGFPIVFPAIQAQSANSKQILFTTSVFSEYVSKIKAGTRMALYGMSLDMETVLVRGEFKGYSRKAGILTGMLDIDWVYNSMPPVPGQIYPSTPLEAITDF